MGANRWLSRGLSWARDALSPLASLIAIVGWIATALWLVAMIDDPPDSASWWLAPIVVALASGALAAKRFSWISLLAGALVMVVLAGSALVRIGLAQTDADQRDAFRRAATASLSEVAELRKIPLPRITVDEARSALEDAQQAVEEARAAAVTQTDDATDDPVRESVIDQAHAALALIDAALNDAEAQQQAIEAAGPLVDELRWLVDGSQPPAPAEAAIADVIADANASVATALGVDAPGRTLRSVDNAATLATELCTAAGGSVVEAVAPATGDRCGTATSTESTPEPEGMRLLAVRTAQAQLATAEAALALADDEGKDAATATVNTRSAALSEALADVDKPADGVPLATAITSGAGAVTSDAFGASEVPIALEALGWALFGLALAWYVRFVSIRNAGRSLGPVTIKPPADADDASELERFRTYLLHNVPEPGGVPGSTTLAEVTNLVGAVDPLVKATVVTNAVKALATAVVAERGYVVEYADLAKNVTDGTESTTTGATATATDTAIVVRVREARTTSLIDQKVVRKPTRDMALRAGAYWAAAQIIEASKVVPSWARWDPASSDALATFHEADDFGTVTDLAGLRKAIQLAPTSGVLGLRLANAEAMSGDEGVAFARAAQTVRLHPRYQNARYRLAITASMLSAELGPLGHLPVGTREQLVDDIRALEAEGLAAELAVARGNKDRVLSVELCTFAIHQLKSSRRKLFIGHVLWQALRNEGRSEQLSLLWFRRRRREVKLVGASCRFAILARRALFPPEPDRKIKDEIRRQAEYLEEVRRQAEALKKARRKAEKFEDRVSRRGPLWQVFYNLACFWSVAGKTDAEFDRAFGLLEMARRSRGSGQLKASWLRKDIDLLQLRKLPRFEAFATLLHDEESQ